jgi:hypothetical protein
MHSESRADCNFARRSEDGYQGMMSSPAKRSVTAAVLCLGMAAPLPAQQSNAPSTPSVTGTNAAQSTAASAPAPAPSGNRYDVLSKTITPMASVLLGGSQSAERAMTLRANVGQVAGRLPQAIQGASLKVQIQYPGRIRVEAPVLGETLTVCRNGNEVWAMPGSKIQFLLGQFKEKPRAQQKNGAPLTLPFTAQQAVLLPALFQLERTAEIADVGGSSCRVIEGGLMPEIAKAAKAEDFSAKLWICSEYTPKRIDIHRSDFAMSFLIEELTYSAGFPPATWQPPAGATDVYRCDASQLEQLLYVLMNSLQMSAEDKPWLNEAAPASPITPQGTGPFGPVQ